MLCMLQIPLLGVGGSARILYGIPPKAADLSAATASSSVTRSSSLTYASSARHPIILPADGSVPLKLKNTGTRPAYVLLSVYADEACTQPSADIDMTPHSAVLQPQSRQVGVLRRFHITLYH